MLATFSAVFLRRGGLSGVGGEESLVLGSLLLATRALPSLSLPGFCCSEDWSCDCEALLLVALDFCSWCCDVVVGFVVVVVVVGFVAVLLAAVVVVVFVDVSLAVVVVFVVDVLLAVVVVTCVDVLLVAAAVVVVDDVDDNDEAVIVSLRCCCGEGWLLVDVDSAFVTVVPLVVSLPATPPV